MGLRGGKQVFIDQYLGKNGVLGGGPHGMNPPEKLGGT